MFRTILVHHQEQIYKLYIAFGICRYHTSGCCVVIATQQPQVSAYTGIYQMRCVAYNVAPDDGPIQSETCRASNGKWSLITRILCILLVYIHIFRHINPTDIFPRTATVKRTENLCLPYVSTVTFELSKTENVSLSAFIYISLTVVCRTSQRTLAFLLVKWQLLEYGK